MCDQRPAALHTADSARFMASLTCMTTGARIRQYCACELLTDVLIAADECVRIRDDAYLCTLTYHSARHTWAGSQPRGVKAARSPLT